MFTFSGLWFMKFVKSLEAFRRGQAGALGIGIFVTIDNTTFDKTMQRITLLAALADTMITLIDELPPPVSWVAFPYRDNALALR